MKIIDTHVHPEEIEMQDASVRVGNCMELSCLKKEMKRHGLVGAVVISLVEQRTPSESIEMLKQISSKEKNMKCIYGVDPYQVKAKDVTKLEAAMKAGSIDGIKIFPAYFPKYPNDKAYHKFYKLCTKYDLPTIIHGGAVMKEEKSKQRIYQKYAHPMAIDDVAVDFPDMRILMAHAGYPWLITAAQVAYKNDNVWLDFSGLREGEVDLEDTLDKHRIDWIIGYLENDKKIMYGSDWPLVEMGEYMPWLKKMVPKKLHTKFFFENAKKFFGFKV